MDQVQVKITTYGCPNCPYVQNTDPYDAWQQHPDMFPGVPLGLCPSCYPKGEFKMGLLLANDTPTIMTIASDADLDGRVKIEQAPGQPVQEIPLSTQESADLVDRRNQALDALSAIAVQELPAPTPPAA